MNLSGVRRTLEFGIYRDGDNNLDRSQAVTLAQALEVSAENRNIEFTVEDTTSRNSDSLETRAYRLADGEVRDAKEEPAHDMASARNLARFVARTLDDAERCNARQTWIELSDHGAGDGGGLEADSAKAIMSIDSMAAAISEGVRMHAQAHPEDAPRRVDGVVANQCLMASLGFADELSHAGVRFLAASPETMISPGTPTTVASAIANHTDDPNAMAASVVRNVMHFTYEAGLERWHPAAAFDVLDLDANKWACVERNIKAFNDTLESESPAQVDVVRQDARKTEGMVRFPHSNGMPWRADRPAITLYTAFANDGRLDSDLRLKAKAAAGAIATAVLAHAESRDVAPFGDADYRDAVGPTVHFPVRANEVDPWAPRVSETNNAFYRRVDGEKVANATVARFEGKSDG